MMLDRPDEEAVEAAVEGRWVLNLAICASDRAVLVRPALLSVSWVAPGQPQAEGAADTVDAVHVFRLSCTAQARRSTAQRSGHRPAGKCSAGPSRSLRGSAIKRKPGRRDDVAVGHLESWGRGVGNVRPWSW